MRKNIDKLDIYSNVTKITKNPNLKLAVVCKESSLSLSLLAQYHIYSHETLNIIQGDCLKSQIVVLTTSAKLQIIIKRNEKLLLSTFV